MKSSKAEIQAKYHKIPMIRFEDQKLTSFSGLVIFQALFRNMNLKERLRKCFANSEVSPLFGRHLVVLLLIVHLLLGFRRLREVDYYRDGPLVLRQTDQDDVEKVRELFRSLVIEGLRREGFPRLTFDFDGSVQSTKGHAEGTAVGFNKGKKGARSYYPLLCTVALTGQFFDMRHRPGNVHDSNGAEQFMLNCFKLAREQLGNTLFESRMDSAFFNKDIIGVLDSQHVKFTASVPLREVFRAEIDHRGEKALAAH